MTGLQLEIIGISAATPFNGKSGVIEACPLYKCEEWASERLHVICTVGIAQLQIKAKTMQNGASASELSHIRQREKTASVTNNPKPHVNLA